MLGNYDPPQGNPSASFVFSLATFLKGERSAGTLVTGKYRDHKWEAKP